MLERNDMLRKTVQKLDFSKNLIYYYLAIGVVIFGYIFLSIGDANSFTSLTLGPIILLIGYLAAIPIALLSKTIKKEEIVEKKETEKVPPKKIKK